MTTDMDRGPNVVTLEAARPRPLLPALAKIEGYWEQVRARRLVPSRCEIDPRGLEGVLAHAFILERIAGGLARFRIAGSHLADLAGLELRQMPASALFLPASREILSEALTAVFEEPSAIRMTLTSPAGFGREALEGEMTLLPLRSDLGDIDRVLGGLVLTGRTGRTPRRLEITGQTRRSLVGYAGPAHLGEALFGSPATAPKPTEIKRNKKSEPVTHMTRKVAPANAASGPAGRTVRPWLRLVVDNV